MSELDSLDLFNNLQKTLSWSKKRDYRGYSKHDALNSQFLNAFSLRLKPLRLLAIQAVMRAPVNIRPLLGVQRELNPKGLGLFAHSYLDSAAFLKYHQEVDSNHLKEYSTSNADRLLTWLDVHISPWTQPEQHRYYEQLAGKGWGYPYPWQDWGFFQPRDFPNRVVTSWIGHAFLRGFEVLGDEKFLRSADEICTFLLGNPKRLFESDDQLCLSYLPLENMDWAVMDVSALASSVCARTAFHTKIGNRAKAEARFKTARRLMNFVVDKQTDYGAWFYTWPAKASHIKHDNYHTGIILDCLADYMLYSENHTWYDNYEKGLVFYRDNLFTKNGAPKWMSNRTFPNDIHGAAAGILAFTRAARYFKNECPEPDAEKAAIWMAEAEKVLDWTMKNMYNKAGYFYYQKRAMYKKRFCLMRWCNAWMTRALSQYILTKELVDSNAPSLTAAYRW